jgi:L-aminopeptidase/D-esterase-like protein
VGKLRGYEHCTKSGQGTWSANLPGGLIVGAIAAVNSFGDVYGLFDRAHPLAGVRDDQGRIIGTMQAAEKFGFTQFGAGGNTVIAVVATNARLTKSQCTKAAGMAHNGLVRVIYPVHTTADGDTVFVLATGEVEADLNIVGVAAQEVLARAVIRAVTCAENLGGIRAISN